MFDRNESKDAGLTPELAALEAKLAGLAITPLKLDRDQLMFEAGRAAGLREYEVAATQRVAGTPRWFWPSASGLLAAACLVLSAMLVWQRDDGMVADRGDARENEAITIAPPSAGELRDVERLAARGGVHLWSTPPARGYLEQRHIALTRDVEELPAIVRVKSGGAPSENGQPATARELLREFVPTSDAESSSNS